jgi:hypothetical protein
MMLINHFQVTIYVVLLRSIIFFIFLSKKINLKFQLKRFKLDVLNHSKLQNLSSITELFQKICREKKKSKKYYFIDRLICFDSFMTTEQAFSTIKVIKTRRLCNSKLQFKFDSCQFYFSKKAQTTILN